MSTSVIINSTDSSENKMQQSITHIDPNATNSAIMNFVEGLNSLTNKTLTDVRKITTTDIMNNEKPSRNFQILDENYQPTTTLDSSTVVDFSNHTNAPAVWLSYIGNTKPNIEVILPDNDNNVWLAVVYVQEGFDPQRPNLKGSILFLKERPQDSTQGVKLVITVPENENYQAASEILTFV